MVEREDVNIISNLKLLDPKIKRRKLVLAQAWNNWDFKMYFGSSLQEQVHELDVLDYSMFAFTESLDRGNLPTMPGDLSGVLITFGNRAFAKWSKPTRKDLEETVEKSFRTKINFSKEAQ